MNYVLFIFLFGFLGPQTHGQPFSTLEECEREKAAVVVKVAEHNASKEPVKIIYYSAQCAPASKAPQGKDV